MKDELMKNEDKKVKFPLPAVLFFSFFGINSALIGLLSVISCITVFFQYYEYEEVALSHLLSIVINGRYALIFVAVILTVVALCRKKCGKLMAAGGILLIFASLAACLLSVVETVLLGLIDGERITWILDEMHYSYLRNNAAFIMGTLPHLLLGVFLLAGSFKKARQGLSALWYFPIIIVIGSVMISDIVAICAWLSEGVVILIVRFLLLNVNGMLILSTVFFALWLRNPYKKPRARKPSKEEKDADVAAPAKKSGEENVTVWVQTAESAKKESLRKRGEERGEELRQSLEEFKSLYEQGLITEEEFAEKKRQLLGL
ncbi:MAG: SHOCT domain-containing protein [Clostridia bacterium]|nr:SHOCT domain-containing protein [Clostridia bacterium]